MSIFGDIIAVFAIINYSLKQKERRVEGERNSAVNNKQWIISSLTLWDEKRQIFHLKTVQGIESRVSRKTLAFREVLSKKNTQNYIFI